MKHINHTNLSVIRRRSLAPCAATIAALFFISFVVFGPTTLSAQQVTGATGGESQSETVVLSPFIVQDNEDDTGYQTSQSLFGSRTSKDLLHTAGFIAIINREMIDDLNADRVSDLLKFGQSAMTANARFWDDFDIRGFRAGGSMRNGVTTSYRFGVNEPLYDVGRVEVIKGPVAMLTGNNTSLGGGVNFVPIAPSFTPGGHVQATVGENAYFRFQANTVGPIRETEQFKAAYRFTLGGATGDTEKTYWDVDEKFIGGALSFYFGDRTVVNMNYYYFDNGGYAYLDDFVDVDAFVSQQPYPAGFTPYSVIHENSTESFVPVTGLPDGAGGPVWDRHDRLFDITITTKLTEDSHLRLFYQNRNLFSMRHLPRTLFVMADPTDPGYNVMLSRQWLELDDHFKHSNLQVDYQSTIRWNQVTFESMIGADQQIAERRDYFSAVSPLPSLDSNNPDYSGDAAFFVKGEFPCTCEAGSGNSGRIRNRNPSYYSYYFQENVSFWDDRITLLYGLRWYNPGGIDYIVHKNGVPSTDGATRRSTEGTRVHKYGVVLSLSSEMSVYYQNSENVIPQIGTTDWFQLSDALGPALVDSLGLVDEVGFKWNKQYSNAFNTYGSLTYFNQALTNVRTSGPCPGDPNNAEAICVVQTAKDEVTGYEVDLGMGIQTQSGRFDLIFAYFNAQGKSAGRPGFPPGGLAPEKVSFLAKYTWQQGAMKGLMFGAGVMNQSGKRYSADHFINWPVVTNAFARYAWGDGWSVQLNVDNIADHRYINAVATSALISVAEPRFARFSLDYRW